LFSLGFRTGTAQVGAVNTAPPLAGLLKALGTNQVGFLCDWKGTKQVNICHKGFCLIPNAERLLGGASIYFRDGFGERRWNISGQYFLLLLAYNTSENNLL
jgi:hypothetical protein